MDWNMKERECLSQLIKMIMIAVNLEYIKLGLTVWDYKTVM